MKQVNLVLGTMTFGESVFSPDVSTFVNTFLDAGYEELDTAYVYNNGNCTWGACSAPSAASK